MSHSRGSGLVNMNAIRREVVTEAFREAIGRRTLVMTAEFPFVFIGEIREVVSDYVFIFTETTNITALDGNVFRVHIDDITVFTIENGDFVIPEID